MKLTKYVLAVFASLLAFQLNAAEGVARSTFTTAIDNREPTDEVSTLDSEAGKVYYFTEIKGHKDQTISHRWEQNGEVQATVSFDIGGDRWRVWSSKNLQPEFTGEWQVMVVDEAGNVLAQNSFNYGETSSPAATEETVSDAASESSSAVDSTAAEMTATESATDAAIDAAIDTKAEDKPAAITSTPMSDEELSKIAPAAGGKTEPASE